MHRYSLSSSSLRLAVPAAASCVPFSARSFLVHGETSAAAARRWTAAGTPLLATRQVLTFRSSPSPANYACLFLPLLLLSLLHRPPPLRAAVALFPPFVALPPRFFSHLLSLPTLLHAPVFIFPSALFLPYPASIFFILLPSCQLLTFLRAFLTHSTSHISFLLNYSASEIIKCIVINKYILQMFFDEIIFST